MTWTPEVAKIAQSRIDQFRHDQELARETIAMIDRGEMWFQEAKGNETMHDVTPKRRAELERQIVRLDEIIEIWSQQLQPPGA